IGDTLINSVPIINYSNDFMSGFSFDMPEINSIDFEGGVIGKVMEAIDKISKRPIVTNVKMNGRNIVKATHKDFDNLNGEEAALNARMRGVLIG
ncbi:MAG: hypothetical protein ACRDDY_13375, partial [Clostridium sp.]|uniref:hypothetical protein n=1 Tax=Clostridium sp. TaxID=1506 RepID=UPI003EE7F0DF